MTRQSVTAVTRAKGNQAARATTADVRRALGHSALGRPVTLVLDARTLRQLEGCGRIAATFRETASALAVSESTLARFFEECPEGREAWQRGLDAGNRSLRRKQHSVAMKGNPALLIWVGKNRLGQSDKVEASATLTLEHLVLAAVKVAPADLGDLGDAPAETFEQLGAPRDPEAE